MSFNPRARVGRDFGASATSAHDRVSIHAPAWGATVLQPNNRVHTDVSIHAPAWGATYGTEAWEKLWDVSIHAPAWGATNNTFINAQQVCKFQSTRPRGARRSRVNFLYINIQFQSTRPRGARLATSWLYALLKMFQSTRPRGARHKLFILNMVLFGFNPRARVGRDLSYTITLLLSYVSIHAPAWGATKKLNSVINPSYVSIHAPAWGATCCWKNKR